jgi:hypothetical protein
MWTAHCGSGRSEPIGGLAPPPATHRPGTCYKVAEGGVTLYGKLSRAVGVHASSPAQRRQQHLERALQASSATLETSAREAARQDYGCHAEAEAAAAKRRALPRAYHGVAGAVQEERPKYGPGRPNSTQPHVGKARRYGVQVTLHARAEVIARQRQEAGGFGLLTNGPLGARWPIGRGPCCRPTKNNMG